MALKLGTRELVAFCCRKGDLGGEDSPGVKAMEGLRIHQKIQRRYNALAEAEVRVGLNTEIEDTEIELGGRVDLLFSAESPPRIEEIKTVYSHQQADGRRFVRLPNKIVRPIPSVGNTNRRTIRVSTVITLPL